MTHAIALASRSTEADVIWSLGYHGSGVGTLALSWAPGSACHGYLAFTATLPDLPAPPSLDCSSWGPTAWAHAPMSSKRFLPSVKPGLLRVVAYPPNRLLHEVRPAGATALVGLDRAMVRGLGDLESSTGAVS